MTRNRMLSPGLTAGVATAVLATLTPLGCGRADDQETGTISDEEVLRTRAELDADLVAALDSGNAAYRAGDYQAAREQYERAVDVDEDVAAGWFGLYMAHLALGNTAAADSAMARARATAPGATLIHPETTRTER